MKNTIFTLSACEVVGMLDEGRLSSLELIDELESHIAVTDKSINALPIRCYERARSNARNLMQRPPAERGILKGLPVVIKDLTDVAGISTTFGSPMYRDNVAVRSNIVVEQLESNGGIVYAKSNTPEFGAGGNTFNELFGATHNPRNLTLTAGGSSGGAAAALATGMAWLAHGSDLAGSLRTPAAFCGVCSLRPSPGKIPSGPGLSPFDVLSAHGPMARCVADLGLMADAMGGVHPEAGLSASGPASLFSAANRPRKPGRIAFGGDLGVSRIAPDLMAACRSVAELLSNNGVAVEQAHPDFSGVHEAFDCLRGLDFAISLGEFDTSQREQLKPEVLWNIEYGARLSGEEIAAAHRVRARLFQNACGFMRDYDILICPATSQAPFPVVERYPGFSTGLEVCEYYRWLAIAYAITMVTLPVVTIPCGFSDSGMPIGVQLVGKPHGDAELLSHGRYIESLLGSNNLPVIVD